LTENGFMPITPGSGPRHLTFHPSLNFVYILNELGNTITVASYNDATGHLTAVQTVPSLPNDFTGVSTGADIHVSSNGKFLYASNRGHDSIVIYGIDMLTGLLSNQAIDFVSTEGSTPRNFLIHGDILLVANQDSDSIVSFRVNEDTGKLTKLSQVTVPTPSCIKALDLL
jgi:6-phosphogluconolactonase